MAIALGAATALGADPQLLETIAPGARHRLSHALPLSRLERPNTSIPSGAHRPGVTLTWIAAVLAVVPPFLVMQFFLDLPIAAVGSLMLAASVVLQRPRR